MIRNIFKNTLFVLLLLINFSCQEKDTCHPQFEESLTYLKDYLESHPDDIPINEITRNIEVLESISGIMNEDQGNFMGKFLVSSSDIDQWEKWNFNNCPSKDQMLTSNFDLTTDFADFKRKMTPLDTLKIFFDHSICTSVAYERIEITKSLDSIKVKTEFQDLTFDGTTAWSLAYEKKLSKTDTTWQFGKFLKRNKYRRTFENKKRSTLTLKSNQDTLRFFTEGLVDLNRFLEDYYLTMRKIHPENRNGIYGYEPIEIPNVNRTLND